jgi:hypothetical protein
VIDLHLGRYALSASVAAVLLAGCGGAQSGGVPQGTTQVEASGGYETPPNVAGTYRGSYVETRNGQTVKGSFKMVIQQKRFKITGPFDIQGHHDRLSTYFVGKVKQPPQGTLLRLQVVWLGGYGNSVNIRALVTGMTLEGEGQSQVRTRSEGSRWKFKATKTS